MVMLFLFRNISALKFIPFIVFHGRKAVHIVKFPAKARPASRNAVVPFKQVKVFVAEYVNNGSFAGKVLQPGFVELYPELF